MSAPLPCVVLFDLDGTLVDTAPDLADAVNTTLDTLGIQRWSEAQLRIWIGGGMASLMGRALRAADADAGLQARAVAASLEHYRLNLAHRSRPFPGTVTVLRWLRAAGTCLACVTNKRTAFVKPLLQAMHLAEYFDAVVCGDTLSHMKPHPAPLLYAVEQLEVTPAQALMIGDSENDVLAARAAGMPVVCVDYGYNGGKDIRQVNPDAVVSSMDALQDLYSP